MHRRESETAPSWGGGQRRRQEGPARFSLLAGNQSGRDTLCSPAHCELEERTEVNPCSSHTSLRISHAVTQQSSKITSQPVNKKWYNNSSKTQCIHKTLSGDSVEYTQPHYRGGAHVNMQSTTLLATTLNPHATQCAHITAVWGWLMGDTDAPQVATHVLSQQFAASTHVPSVHQRCRESRHDQRTNKWPRHHSRKLMVVILHGVGISEGHYGANQAIYITLINIHLGTSKGKQNGWLVR